MTQKLYWIVISIVLGSGTTLLSQSTEAPTSEGYLLLGSANRGAGEPSVFVNPKDPDNPIVAAMATPVSRRRFCRQDHRIHVVSPTATWSRRSCSSAGAIRRRGRAAVLLTNTRNCSGCMAIPGITTRGWSPAARSSRWRLALCDITAEVYQVSDRVTGAGKRRVWQIAEPAGA